MLLCYGRIPRWRFIGHINIPSAAQIVCLLQGGRESRHEAHGAKKRYITIHKLFDNIQNTKRTSTSGCFKRCFGCLFILHTWFFMFLSKKHHVSVFFHVFSCENNDELMICRFGITRAVAHCLGAWAALDVALISAWAEPVWRDIKRSVFCFCYYYFFLIIIYYYYYYIIICFFLIIIYVFFILFVCLFFICLLVLLFVC